MADTGLTVWAAGFWPDDFWAAGFWSGDDTPLPEQSSSKAAGRKRRRRYQVEIDGQVFDVESPDEALELLAQARELAKKKASQVADKVVAERIKLRTPDRKPIRVPAPQIHTSSDELASIVIKARHDIARIYRQAALDAEIRQRLQWKVKEDDQDSDDDLIMLL